VRPVLLRCRRSVLHRVQRATDVLKDPALLRGCPPPPAGQFPVTPALLARLQADVARCVAAEWLQAPAMDAVRHNAGAAAQGRRQAACPSCAWRDGCCWCELGLCSILVGEGSSLNAAERAAPCGSAS
jgi:hypothetical protein